MVTRPNPIALRKAKASINEAPIDFIDEPFKEDGDVRKPLRSSSVSELRDSKVK
jgi:hypothetical protein